MLKLYISQHFIPPPFGLLKNTYSVFPGEIVRFPLSPPISELYKLLEFFCNQLHEVFLDHEKVAELVCM